MNIRSSFDALLSAMNGNETLGGLEISDSALRYAVSRGKEWKAELVKLSPNVLEAGRIHNRDAFVEALKELHSKVTRKKKKRVGVVVTMSSLSVYSQVFQLPLVSGENLESAVALNLQMASPGPARETYAGWQVVHKDEVLGQLDVLSAFSNKQAIDEVASALEEAQFVPAVVEFRALALARVLRERAKDLDLQKPWVVMNVDDMGIDFLVLRHGELYFEYFNPWRDLHKGRFMAYADFQGVVIPNISRVLNFYNQHWNEPVAEVVLVSRGLESDISKIIQENFSLPVRVIAPPVSSLGSEWVLAVGSGLRGLMSRRNDRELSISGTETQEAFREEQLLYFFHFWRLFMPLVFGCMALALLFGYYRLSQSYQEIASRVPREIESPEVVALKAQARDFNHILDLIRSARATIQPNYKAIAKIVTIANSQAVQVTSLRLSPSGDVTLTGDSSSREHIVNFKKQIESDHTFQNVDLPLAGWGCTTQGCQILSMTFSVNFSALSNAPESSL